MSAVWTVGGVTTTVTGGTAVSLLPLLDALVLQGNLEVSVTPDRQLTVVWRQEPGTPAVQLVGAWSTV